MDYSAVMDVFSGIMMGAATLVAVTNILVEVLKTLLPRVNANWLAIAVAMTVTGVAAGAWMGERGIPFIWYQVPAVLVLGMMVAYGAMFGYDKLREAFEQGKKE